MDDLPKFGKGERGRFVYNQKTGTMDKTEKPKKLIVEAPAVLPDSMEPIESYATPFREVFDSRSAYRRHLQEHGFRESGGEHFKDWERKKEEDPEKDIREDIEKSYYDVKYDRVEFSEQEKENHRREQRACKNKTVRQPY